MERAAMADGRADPRARREPTFETRTDPGRLDLRLTRADRAGGSMPRSRGRADEAEPRGAAPRAGRRRRSLLGRLVYSGLVLSLWAAIALAALLAYHASRLPPI